MLKWNYKCKVYMLRWVFLFFFYFCDLFAFMSKLLKYCMFPCGHDFLAPPILEIMSYCKIINHKGLIWFIHLSQRHCRIICVDFRANRMHWYGDTKMLTQKTGVLHFFWKTLIYEAERIAAPGYDRVNLGSWMEKSYN